MESLAGAMGGLGSEKSCWTGDLCCFSVSTESDMAGTAPPLVPANVFVRDTPITRSSFTTRLSSFHVTMRET